MNTPRTKKPRRYKPLPSTTAAADEFRSGIANDTILKMVGDIITVWPLIEEQMIPVFAELIGLDTDKLGDARLIFRSIINHNTRIAIMRSMLEKSPQHQHLGENIDKLIDDFNALAKTRNNYAHGLWYTSKADGRVFIEGESSNYDRLLDKREVTQKELVGVTARMNKLLSDLLEQYWGRRENRERLRALEESRSKPAPLTHGLRPLKPPKGGASK